MKQIEITTRVMEPLDTVIQKLQNQGFQIIRKSRVEDEYLTMQKDQIKKENILQILSTCVLLRYLNANGKIMKKITYKHKIYQNDIVMTEEKINVDCGDLESAKKLFNALNFQVLVKVSYDVIVLSNHKMELAFQNVENLGLLLEYENERDFSEESEEKIINEKKHMLNEIKQLNILITDEFDVKKAYELINNEMGE